MNRWGGKKEHKKKFHSGTHSITYKITYKLGDDLMEMEDKKSWARMDLRKGIVQLRWYHQSVGTKHASRHQAFTNTFTEHLLCQALSWTSQNKDDGYSVLVSD